MSESVANNTIKVAGILIPHEDTVLFKRMREWLGDEKSFAAPRAEDFTDDGKLKVIGPAHRFLLLEEMKKAAKEMLADLKSKKLILLFASADPQDRVTHHSGFHIDKVDKYKKKAEGENEEKDEDKKEKKIIELLVPESIHTSVKVRKPENALRQISEQALQALTLDALTLYIDNVYCERHRRPLAADDTLKKPKVVVPPTLA